MNDQSKIRGLTTRARGHERNPDFSEAPKLQSKNTMKHGRFLNSYKLVVNTTLPSKPQKHWGGRWPMITGSAVKMQLLRRVRDNTEARTLKRSGQVAS
jgi:hypothetical protein